MNQYAVHIRQPALDFVAIAHACLPLSLRPG
jgi:hypothetical protein